VTAEEEAGVDATQILGSGIVDLTELEAGLVQFGTDWLYTLGPVAAFLLVAGVLWRRGRGAGHGLIGRVSAGAAAASGLPSWTAGTLLVLLVLVLPLAVMGFFWDVAWHIDIGRDEFLFSPPHIALLIGVSGIGLAGLVGVVTATRTDADVPWRMGHWRVPASAAAMLVAGIASSLGWGIDELWHEAYGIDVTMWSPPHLLMIASASFTPIAAWLAFAEAGPGAGNRIIRRHVPPLLATATLIGLSAWQLEFDLGVPQWQTLYQPVLIAAAGGFALTAARAASGRGAALRTAVAFVVFRVLMLGITTHVWGFSEPRFPLYLAAAVAVEAAFLVPVRHLASRWTMAGAGAGTLGLGGTWLWSQVAFHHPWQAALLPGIGVAVIAGIGAGVLGGGLGRLVSHRPVGIHGGLLAVAVVALGVALAVPFPRQVPAGEVTLATADAGTGQVHVTVTTTREDLVVEADRWEVMAWQGGGRELIELVEVESGTYRTARPVPVDGAWKSFIALASRDQLAAVPVRLPADPEIGARAVPVEDQRRQTFVAQTAVMLREAHAGPAWPAIVAYTFLAISELAILGFLGAAAASIARRHGHGHPGAAAPPDAASSPRAPRAPGGTTEPEPEPALTPTPPEARP
jgi:hypothetical protein